MAPVPYNRFLRPGLAAALPHLRALPTPLQRAFNHFDTLLRIEAVRHTSLVLTLERAFNHLDTLLSAAITQVRLAP